MRVGHLACATYWVESSEQVISLPGSRFRKENRELLDPCVLCPFGAGPWHCTGVMFALLSVKSSLVMLMQKSPWRLAKRPP
ncbi:hypothetical protein HPG69_002936 [Diceros bicornis minor]|uniref:Uncharacterized protein n=1 Tax=Diceros bicornis minor TaxID=77932 RepID=A0A7J7ERI8_DICBM|nr:hypothetical protein HPG69_002936 [Diceros bicornis minor]